MQGAAALGTGERVGADERRGRARGCRSIASTICRFELPTSVMSTSGRRGLGSADDICGDSIHGRADDHEIGFGRRPESRSVVPRSMAPLLDGLLERGGIAADADHMRRDPPARSASPIDPPISPTPMMTAVPKRFKE